MHSGTMCGGSTPFPRRPWSAQAPRKTRAERLDALADRHPFPTAALALLAIGVGMVGAVTVFALLFALPVCALAGLL